MEEFLKSPRSWDDYLSLRARYSGDMNMQKIIAPMEHKAWAEDYVKRNPWTGPLGVGTLIPAYQAVKGMGWGNSDANTTPPSLDQLFAGYEGIYGGVLSNLGIK